MIGWWLVAGLAWAAPDPVLLVELGRGEVAELPQVDQLDAEGRLRLVRSLARLGQPEGLATVEALLDDPELEVRGAAAWALGYLPGGPEVAARHLDRLGPPVGWIRGADDLRPPLFEALGRGGRAEDVPRLIAGLGWGGDAAVAAAHALGRMGRAKLPEAQEALPTLVAGLSAWEPRQVQARAFAIYRIGLSDAPQGLRDAVVQRVRTAPTPAARAWLLRAAWPVASGPTREELTSVAAADASPLVRAALAATGGEGVAPALVEDMHPWVSASLAEDPDTLPPGLSLGQLVDASLRGASNRDRTRFAGALLDRDDAGTAEGLALLASTDAVIREAGASLLGRAPLTDTQSAAVLAHLRRERDEGVLVALASSLVDAVKAGAKPGEPAALQEVVGQLARDPAWRVRRAAVDLAAAASAPAPAIAGPVPSVELGDALRIRGARVQTSRGELRLALDPTVAPLAVSNFAKLAEEGFFDGLTFHRVVPGFVVQTGCPRGDGWGGPGYTLPDEVSERSFRKGALGMARGEPDTGGSQWFIVSSDQPHLDGDYTWFGQVTSGQEVVERIRVGDTVTSVKIERSP